MLQAHSTSNNGNIHWLHQSHAASTQHEQQRQHSLVTPEPRCKHTARATTATFTGYTSATLQAHSTSNGNIHWLHQSHAASTQHGQQRQLQQQPHTNRGHDDEAADEEDKVGDVVHNSHTDNVA